MTEQVLVVALADLNGLNSAPPIITEGEEKEFFLDQLTNAHAFFMDRPAAEVDQNYLQIIPYMVVRRGNAVLAYKRTKKGGDGRLHEKWSLGIGGHINPVDAILTRGEVDLPQTYLYGSRRELDEELDISEEIVLDTEAPLSSVCALIYDRSNEVGRVHLGLVEFLRFPAHARIELNAKDGKLVEGTWVPQSELRSLVKRVDFEGWSGLVIEKFF